MKATEETREISVPLRDSASVLAAALRAIAELIEQIGSAGIAVSCDGSQISLWVTDNAGDVRDRARTVLRLATKLCTVAMQEDDAAARLSKIQAQGVLAGLPIRVATHLTVLTRDCGDDATTWLAIDAGGYICEVDDGRGLGPGWRWATELDITQESIRDKIAR